MKNEDEGSQSLSEVISGIEKQHGKGSIMKLGSKTFPPQEVVSTSSLALDEALGVGGIPRGRVVEIYGPECLDAETFVQYEIRTQHRANHKGGSLRRLYERFHNLPASGDGRGKYQRKLTKDAKFFAPSMNAEGRIIQGQIVDVVLAGQKECFKVRTESGQTIVGSLEHIFLTPSGDLPLKALAAGASVYIYNNTPVKVEKPKNSNKNRHSREINVHHKDENEGNDKLENLEMLYARPHGVLHATERHNNLRFIAVPTKITSIEYAGCRDTYDIVMAEPNRNFVADGFVVHNSGGKTTLALHIIAQAQKLGGKAAVIDAEHALDPNYARKLGVNVDELYVSQPDYGEQALEIAESLIKSGKFDIVLVDSVAALVPKAELEGDMGDPQMGLQARLMSQALRKLTAITNKTKTILIFINQIREKIGVMFGNPETTTGGRALKFYSSVRLDIRKTQILKDGDRVVGADTRIKVVKNKVAAPFREAEVRIIYGYGISREYDLLKIGEARQVLEKSGTWFSYKGEKLGQGVENSRVFLVEHPDMAEKIDVELRSIIFPKG